MGEFMDQMMGGGPGLVPLADVLSGMIPCLAEDLDGSADPLAACAAMRMCRPRAIPAPHVRYGHLLFGVSADFGSVTDRVDAIRAVANVVGGAHGAPTFGSSMGDVPASDVAEVLAAHGFGGTASAWLEAERSVRAREAVRVACALVWEVPKSMIDSSEYLDTAARSRCGSASAHDRPRAGAHLR